MLFDEISGFSPIVINGDLDLSFYSLNHIDESEQKMSSFTIHYQKQEQHVIFTI